MLEFAKGKVKPDNISPSMYSYGLPHMAEEGLDD